MPFCSSKWQRPSKPDASRITTETTRNGCATGFALSVTCRSMQSHADLRVNFLECWEWDRDTVQHFSWITDLRVNKGTVYQIMRGGRARLAHRK